MPDYFEARFKDDTHLLRIVSMAVIVFFFTFYVAAQFLAASKVLNTTFGIAPIWGMVIGAAIILFYTIMGGFFAVAWTDLVQGILMAGAMILLPIAAFMELGGVAGVAEKVGAIDPNLLLSTGGQTGRPLIMGLIIGSLGIGLGYVGQPHLLTRFMAIRSPRDIRKGTMIAMSWVVVAFWGAVLVGIAGLAHFGPEGLVLSWPSAEGGALPIEGGVAVAFRREIAAAEDPVARRTELEEEFAARRTPFPRAESFSVNDLIDPRQTRRTLCDWLEWTKPLLRQQLGPRSYTFRP